MHLIKVLLNKTLRFHYYYYTINGYSYLVVFIFTNMLKIKCYEIILVI